MKYIDTIYDATRTPKSDYPAQLVSHIKNRYLDSKNGLKVVELGCGRGDFLNEFSSQGFSCIGLDRDPAAKACLSDTIEFFECDLSKGSFPIESESVDVIYHKSFIEHVYDPLPVLQESLRILKKGGKMVVLTPDWETQWMVFYEDFTHCRPYTVTTLQDCFKAIGLEVEHVAKFTQLPWVWNSVAGKSLSSFWRFFFRVRFSRWLTKVTGIKFFRWSSELMVIGVGKKT